MTESARLVFHQGFAPVFTVAALEALASGLRVNDPRIIQRATTSPPPLMSVAEWPCEGADPIAYAGWMSGETDDTVGGVESYFANLCYQADVLLGEMTACRWLLNWIDDTDREVMVRELLVEVEIALTGRKPVSAQAIAA